MAFSQIDYLGKWKNAKLAKQNPARLKYCFRNIVLYELLKQNNELYFENIDGNSSIDYEENMSTSQDSKGEEEEE